MTTTKMVCGQLVEVEQLPPVSEETLHTLETMPMRFLPAHQIGIGCRQVKSLPTLERYDGYSGVEGR